MNSRRTVILAVATIILTAILRPTRANAQGVSVPVSPPGAHPVLPVVEGGEASQEERSTQVMSKLLPDFPGKEVVILASKLSSGTLWCSSQTQGRRVYLCSRGFCGYGH